MSAPYPGKTHDLTIRRREDPIPRDSLALVDSGYQGLQKKHQKTKLPIKKTKKKPLSKEDKKYNHKLSSVRVLVENIICKLKDFQILHQQFRNRRYRYGLIMQITAAIVNLKMGF